MYTIFSLFPTDIRLLDPIESGTYRFRQGALHLAMKNRQLRGHHPASKYAAPRIPEWLSICLVELRMGHEFKASGESASGFKPYPRRLNDLGPFDYVRFNVSAKFIRRVSHWVGAIT